MRGGIKGTIGALVLGSLLVASAPGLAGAQTRGSVGIGGGAGIPIGDFKDAAKIGWLVQVNGMLKFSDMLGARINGTYGQNKEKAEDHNLKAISVFGDVVVSPTTSGGASPYVLAGAGMMRLSDGESETAFAWNAGAGVGFAAGSLGLFLEARFQQARKHGHSTNMIPVTVGVRLGGK